MLTRTQMEDNWRDLVHAVNARWPVVGREELEEARGSVGHLVGLIQQRTGEDRATVERFVASVVNPVQSLVRHASRQLSASPWTAVGSGAAIGFVAGLLIAQVVTRRSG